MITFYFQLAAAALLITATVLDMRTGRIPNWVSLTFIGLFAIMAILTMAPVAIAWQVGFAVATFLFGIVLFMMVGFGAGAVKLLASVALFLPMERSIALFLILMGTMFGLGLVVTIVRRVFGSEDSKWAVLRKPVMPLSLPICATALIGIFLL